MSRGDTWLPALWRYSVFESQSVLRPPSLKLLFSSVSPGEHRISYFKFFKFLPDNSDPAVVQTENFPNKSKELSHYTTLITYQFAIDNNYFLSNKLCNWHSVNIQLTKQRSNTIRATERNGNFLEKSIYGLHARHSVWMEPPNTHDPSCYFQVISNFNICPQRTPTPRILYSHGKRSELKLTR